MSSLAYLFSAARLITMNNFLPVQCRLVDMIVYLFNTGGLI